jgi:thiamine-monophosphate kinase
MREDDLLEHIRQRSADLWGSGVVLVGPGDDAAVLNLGPGPSVFTVDQLIAGRHFDPQSTPIELVARKAMARSVSDIAAMAATPVAALATCCMPSDYPHALELAEHLSRWARHYGCPLVGGDIATSPGPLVLTTTVIGTLGQGDAPVLRSGARAGDVLCMTGRVGGSLASGRHLTFEPRTREALWLRRTLGDSLHAMIDVSDGLGLDTSRLARASGVRVDIDRARAPLHPDAGAWDRAFQDGEDYELVFAVAPGASVPRECPESGVEISVIGRVSAGAGCFTTGERGAMIDLSRSGWDHGQ